MAEEYRSGLNRLKNKAGDGEDPVLVAQRFLNIFRQLHIFDEKRHAEFKAQILALSPDIRGAFGMLPGGQALQEYADEVVREAGGAATNADMSAATAQGTILSAAMAEAAPSVPPQHPSAPQSQAAPQPQVIPQIIQAGGGKIVADEAFAQTLAQAFAKALQFSDNNKKEDIKELITAIRESKATVAAGQTQEMPVQAAGTAPAVAAESKLVADEEFAQTLARSFAKALQFSDANKKEDIKELIAAIRESKTTVEAPAAAPQAISEQQPVRLSADESFAQMLATSFTQALETANAGKTGEMQELIDAIKGIKIDIPQAVAPTAASAQELSSAGAAPQLNIDSNFAQILAQSFASALEMSNAGHRAEMQELITAIRESGRTAAPVQGGELQPNPTAFRPQEPLTVIADERFAQSISQSLSTALETFGQNQADGFKELAQAFRESQAEIRPAAGADFTAAPINGGSIKVVADENFAMTLAKSFSSAIVFSDQKRVAEMEKLVQAIQNNRPQVVYASGETVQPQQSAPAVSNDNLVREITEALSNAINSSKSETIELTNAIRESQSELAKILLQSNTQSNASAANNNANTIQINNAPIVLPIDEIVGRVIEAQSGFLKEMSRHQTEELSSVISSALKESQELSSRTIVDAIKAFQEENLQLIRTLPVQVREVRVQEVPVQTVQATAVPVSEESEEEVSVLPADISLPDMTEEEKLPETFAADATDESKKKKKKKKKKKSKSAEDGLADPRPIPQFVQDDVTNATEPAGGNAFLDVSLFGDVEDSDINSLLPDVQDDNDDDELLSVGNGEDAADFVDDIGLEVQESAFDDEEALSEETAPEEEYEYPEDAAESTDEAAYPQEQENLSAEPGTAEEIFEEEPQNEFAEALQDNAAAEEPDLSADTEEAEAPETEQKIDEQEISAPKKAPRNSLFDSINRSIKSSSKSDFDRYIKSEFESATIEEDEVSGADWGFGTTEESEPEVPAAEYKGWVSEDEEEGVEGQDWEWEYEDNPDVAQMSAEGVEGQDWEWEYEESSADDSEGQDWEWAYEEVSDTEAAAGQSVVAAEDQGWEWVYEENYAAFTVYGQEVDVSVPVQLNANLLFEDGKSNSRRNNQKRLRLKSETGSRLPDEIMIAELQKPEERPQPYAGTADI